MTDFEAGLIQARNGELEMRLLEQATEIIQGTRAINVLVALAKKHGEVRLTESEMRAVKPSEDAYRIWMDPKGPSGKELVVSHVFSPQPAGEAGQKATRPALKVPAEFSRLETRYLPDTANVGRPPLRLIPPGGTAEPQAETA